MRVKTLFTTIYNSPVGALQIFASAKGVAALSFVDKIVPVSVNDNPHLQSARQQLAEYFAGTRKEFDLEFDLQGTDFQKQVWQELTKIPHGQIISYSKIAENIGNNNAARAVGTACSQNPLLIIIPCHRVIGVNGFLSDYVAGRAMKLWLIRNEGYTGDLL